MLGASTFKSKKGTRMTDFAAISHRAETALGLTTPPVAVSFFDEPPKNVAMASTPVPAGCSFWEIGAKTTVATSAEHHALCSIGIHTHNLADAPSGQPRELESALAAMQGLDYVRPAEIAALPVMTKSNKHVVYGPLSAVTSVPDVVLLFARASQSLIISEASARVDGGAPLAMGRPACALIPQVLNSSRCVSSLGCCGARAYLDVMSDDIALWGLPGEKLDSYVAEIEILANANSVLAQFHQIRKAAVESGESPTVEQSLAKLG
jgi:uncharacterized protein (DUF169 family)